MENIIPDKKITLRTIVTKTTFLGKLLKAHRKHNLYAEITCQYIDEVGVWLAKAQAIEEDPNGRIIIFSSNMMEILNYPDTLEKSVHFMDTGIDIIKVFISENLNNFIDLKAEEELRQAEFLKTRDSQNCTGLLWAGSSNFED